MSETVENLIDKVLKLPPEDKRQVAVGVLAGFTLLESADLAKDLEDKFGVSPMMAAAPVAAAAADVAEAAPTKDEFDVVVTSPGEKKLNVIKAIREVIPGLGLGEVKAMLDELPKAILSGVTKEEADKAKATLEGAGAVVELK